MELSRVFNKLLLVSCAVTMLPGCGSKEPAPRNDVYHNVFLTNPIVNGDGSDLMLPGMVEERHLVSVGFKTAGQIERMLVDEGDHVVAGQLLAVLDTVDYALGVGQLRHQVETTRSEVARKKQLHDAKNMSDNEYEWAVSQLAQLELQLETNENKLRYCYLKAPVSGVIVSREHERAEMVDSCTKVFELMDDGGLQVIVDLPVRYYADRDRFNSFTGYTALDPEQLINLNMISLTPRADNNQLYRMRLAVPATAHLTSGMNINVAIGRDAAGDTTVDIPLSAMWQKGGQTYVWRYSEADSTIRAI